MEFASEACRGDKEILVEAIRQNLQSLEVEAVRQNRQSLDEALLLEAVRRTATVCNVPATVRTMLRAYLR